MILGLYRFATTALGPFITLYLQKRKAQGKEDPGRFGERLGQAGLPRPDGPLIWIHAASVGEALSVLGLTKRLLEDRPDLSVMVTTGTVTSAGLMAERLPEGAFHQYFPVDRPPYVRAFLNHWKPDLALWAESEFWPNMLSEAKRRGLPMILVNGRISEKSFTGWQRFPGFIRTLLESFSLALGQTETDKERLEALGAPRAECLGNLKFAAPPLPVDETVLKDLRDKIGDRKVWLAASTHSGEEALAGRVHAKLNGALTIIVPRHPQRGADIQEELKTFKVARRSLGEPLTGETELYLADTMGELGLFFRLCPVVFMGKSILGQGGQNPIEPALLGRAVLFGPHMENFSEIAARMVEGGAALQVADETALAGTVARLLETPEDARTLGETAEKFATAEAGVLDRLVERLSPYLVALS